MKGQEQTRKYIFFKYNGKRLIENNPIMNCTGYLDSSPKLKMTNEK